MGPSLVGPGKGHHGFTKRFTWNGPGVQTGAADDTFFFYNRYPFPQFGRLNGSPLSGRSAADANQIIGKWMGCGGGGTHNDRLKKDSF
jgi:hypothetical protein